MDPIPYEPVAAAPPRRGPWPAVVLGVLAAAQLHLLFCHLNPNAPLRQGFGREAAIARNAAAQAQFDGQLVARVGGRTVEAHFVEPRPPSPASGMVACGLYYGLNYALWPNRAVVGDGRAIVNDAATLRAADRLPPDAALAGRVAVLTFGVAPGQVSTGIRMLAGGGERR